MYMGEMAEVKIKTISDNKVLAQQQILTLLSMLDLVMDVGLRFIPVEGCATTIEYWVEKGMK